MHLLVSKNYFYTSKLTPLNYAHIVGAINTQNYVKKIRITLKNYVVEFYSIMMGLPV
jgi:hypothetical protein